MKRHGTGRSLFIVEIGILFVIFVIAIVICVSLFFSAGTRNHKANNINSAAIKAVTIADTIKSSNGNMKQAQKLLHADKDFNIYYDQGWNTDGEKIYQASVAYTIKNHMLVATINFKELESGEDIYTLKIKEFLQEVRP